MNAAETIETFMTALQSGDLELAASVMIDDFTLIGFTPEALSGREFLALQSDLLAGMPDFSYHLSAVQQEDGRVRALIQITGTQRNDLTLAPLGLQTIPATGLAVDLPQVPVEYSVVNGRVAKMALETVPGGGLSGLLQQLDAELPVLPREKEIADPAYAEDEQHITDIDL